MTYLLDSNVFIEANNRHYGFDFCPAFWDWLEMQNSARKVLSIEKVAQEIISFGDHLSDWVRAKKRDFFLPADDLTAQAMENVSIWANAQKFSQSAVAKFLSDADSWLVAHGIAHKCTVVTQEVPANSPNKIKVPDACRALGVKCINTYEMLRREKAKFVLGKGN